MRMISSLKAVFITVALIVMGFLLSQTISIKCEKVLEGQVNAEVNCQLSNRFFGLVDFKKRTVSGVTGATLDKDKEGTDDVVYRVALLTSEGEVYPTVWYSSGNITKQEVVDQINRFIRDPEQNSLRASLPVLSFWEKDTPLYLLLVAGIVIYVAWSAWMKRKKRSGEAIVDDFREREALEGQAPMTDSVATAINRWGGITAIFLFLMIALLIPGLKVYTLYQEGYPIDTNLINQVDPGELTILLIISGIMLVIALGFAWHTYKNWIPTREAYDEGIMQKELIDNELREFKESEENKVKERIESGFPPELQSRLWALYEPFYHRDDIEMFLTILRRAKGNIAEIERLAKFAESVGYDRRSFYD